MTDMLDELRQLARSWRECGDDDQMTPAEAAEDLLGIIGEDPVLPLSAGLGQVTATLEIDLGSVIIPGNDERPEGLTLGHLVAAQIASRVLPDLDDLRQRADAIADELLHEHAKRTIHEAMTSAEPWEDRTRADMTLAELIDGTVHRLLTAANPATVARGRANVPTIDAIVATAVTTALRDLTGEQVSLIVGKILADIAGSGGRG